MMRWWPNKARKEIQKFLRRQLIEGNFNILTQYLLASNNWCLPYFKQIRCTFPSFRSCKNTKTTVSHLASSLVRVCIYGNLSASNMKTFRSAADLQVIMMAEAIIDVPAIPRINKLESVNMRRHSTGKLFMPNGGLTVFSRYLRSPQGSCHDICKYGTSFTLETESKCPRSPMPKIVITKQGAGRTLERTESKLGERRKKSEISLKVSPDFKIQEPNDPVVIKIAPAQGEHHVENVEANLTSAKKYKISVQPSDDTKLQKPDYPVVSLKPSPEDLVDIKTMAVEDESQDEEQTETKLSRGEKNPEVSVKPSPDSKSQKPFAPDCIESEASSWTDKEFVSPKQMLLPLKETDFTIAHAKGLKLKPQSKASSLLRQACSSSKQNFEGWKRKETHILLMTSQGVSSGRNKGEMTISKGMRSTDIGDKKNVMPPTISLSPEEPNTSFSSMKAKKEKLRGVYHSQKQENAKQIKPEKLCCKNAKGSDNLKGVSHLMDQENVKKPNSEQAKFSNIPEKTLYLIESNPENKPAESIQSSVLSVMPSSSSEDKSMKHNRNRIPEGQSPWAYGKKNMIYRPKGIHACELPPSLSSMPCKKSLRSTPKGLNVTQPSLTSLSLLASSKSSHGDGSSEHDKAAAQNQKSTSKMTCKGRPKTALIITSKDKHLQGEKLNFQRGKMIEVLPEDCTPRKLAIEQRVLTDNRNDDNRNGKVKDCTPRRLKFRRRVLVDDRNGDNQNGRGEEFTPRRLKFWQRVLVDNRNADDQNGKGDDCTPRKLKFRQRVLVDNRNADDQNGKGEDYTPRKLKFRRRVLVDNRNSDDQNGKGEDCTPRKLKFRRRVLVDNRNSDDQNGKGEDCTPRKLKFRRRVLDDNKTSYIRNSEGGTSENNSRGTAANVSQDNATEVQSERISLRHNDVEEKKDSGILYNNMIEQTASQLVRTNSSKVKALVSAFETVISHLDTRF
ncbi:uncharacterized protein LOC111290287 [Durio zibethinus]|uniref:Uncharacterized protein LOC111290287 n=1 Tax=Durio zibethinus TaxID=66656 RepID=A0A6P5YBB6_DURZI|nr:uncharacterized protein LOC111290287 [Durio zibethinus]